MPTLCDGGTTFIPSRGADVLVYISAIDDTNLVAPVSQTVELSTSVAKGDTSISVSALAGAIYKHQALTFVDGDGVARLVRTSASAESGATSISIYAADEAIAATSSANYPPFLRHRTEQNLSQSINTAGPVTTDSGGKPVTIVIGAEQSISAGGVYSYTDAAYDTARLASVIGSGGNGQIWVTWQAPPPSSAFSKGLTFSGLATVTSLNVDASTEDMLMNPLELQFTGKVCQTDPVPV